MTVQTDLARISYDGDGTTGPFAIPFYFLANGDIVVVRTQISDGAEYEMILTTDYTLTGAGDEAGGELTLVATLSSAYRLSIINDPQAVQTVRYPRGDKFPAATHERALDRLTMLVQRLRDRIARALTLSDGDESADLTLPAVDTRVNKFFTWDSNGNPSVSEGTGTDSGLRADLASSNPPGAALITFHGTDLNIGIGDGTLANITVGVENIAIGPNAMLNATSGDLNVAIGYQSMQQSNEGDFNVAIGHSTFFQNTTGHNGVAIGAGAGNQNQDGESNTYVGSGAGFANVSGIYNVAMGRNALVNNLTGWNIAFGGESMYTNAFGEFNISIGFDSMLNHYDGDFNVAIGAFAMAGADVVGIHTTGDSNVAIGDRALTLIDGGSFNVAVGNFAGGALIGGYENTFVGSEAGYKTSTGVDNVFVGRNAGHENLVGINNVCVGNEAGYQNTGSHCIFIGWNAGFGGTANDRLVIANRSAGPFPVVGDLTLGAIKIGINRTAAPVVSPFAIGTDAGSSPPIFANNAAATAGGLLFGEIYRTGGDPDVLAMVH